MNSCWLATTPRVKDVAEPIISINLDQTTAQLLQVWQNYIGVDPASSGSKCDLNDVDLVEACLRMWLEMARNFSMDPSALLVVIII